MEDTMKQTPNQIENIGDVTEFSQSGVSKNNSIAGNKTKNLIRNQIIDVTLEWLRYCVARGLPVELYGATLCGMTCEFEHQLINRLKSDGTVGSVIEDDDIVIECAELSTNTDKNTGKNVFIEAARNLPIFYCTLTPCGFDDLLTHEIHFGRGRHIGTLVKNTNEMKAYNFLWPDYCQTPNRHRLEQAAIHVKKSLQRGLYFITFSLTGRQHGQESIMKREFMREALEDNLFHYFDKHDVKKVRKVYDVVYSGGKGTTMITMGFSIDVPKKAITPIEANYQITENERKAVTNQIGYKLKHDGIKKYLPKTMKQIEALTKKAKKAKKGKRGRKKMALLDKVLSRRAKGMTKEEIAKDLGITLHQVGSTLAHTAGLLYQKKLKLYSGEQLTTFITRARIHHNLEANEKLAEAKAKVEAKAKKKMLKIAEKEAKTTKIKRGRPARRHKIAAK
jgi:hypothetical protein